MNMDSRKLSGFLYKNAQMGLYTIPMLLSVSKDKRFNALLRQQYAFYRSFAKRTAKLPREKDIRLSCLEINDYGDASEEVLLLAKTLFSRELKNLAALLEYV